MHDILPSKGMCGVSRDLFKFQEISDSISLMVQDIVAVEHYRKSYVAYRMTALPIPLNDLEGHLCCLKLYSPISSEM